MRFSYDQLFENNKAWASQQTVKDPSYFSNMALGQNPEYLFIGCSDSRAPASVITGTRPGEIFEHRNISNLVISTDMNLMAVLQYSVDILKVKHIVVCGHYGCGGVKAALSKTHNGLIDNWLRSIRDVYRQYRKELDHLTNEEEKWRKLVELNVQEQVFRLSMTSIVQEALDRHQEIHLHGWVYEIENGLIRDLDLNIKRDFKDFDIYNCDHSHD
ncbi:MAG: carbonic anhydrase [Cytophagales bacterium]|nr:carbonic anhydrase [Cytophagales bacterium]